MGTKGAVATDFTCHSFKTERDAAFSPEHVIYNRSLSEVETAGLKRGKNFPFEKSSFS
jgi:hypothetical protein